MRLVCELILIIGLIALGWQKSFRQWSDEWRGVPSKAMPVRQTTAVNTEPPHQPFTNVGYARTAPRVQPSISNGEWMWDSKHKSALDRPAYNKQPLSGYYEDTAGRKYWIDNRGYRHYEGSGSAP